MDLPHMEPRAQPPAAGQHWQSQGLGKHSNPALREDRGGEGALKKGGFGAPSPELGKGCQMEAFNDCM